MAMGAPTSAILAETFIQHMEHKPLYPILKTQKIISYCKFVMTYLYDQNTIKIEHTLNEFNNIQP
jgi:hypothetical protein